MAHVVVVDDNRDTCELLARLLRRAGHHSNCHTSSREAIERLRTHRPDLVILDVMMPGMTGLELLRWIRAEAGLAGVPVLMFTALSDAKTQAEAERLGAMAYVVKGAGWSDLQAEIQKHIGAGRSSGTGPDKVLGGGE